MLCSFSVIAQAADNTVADDTAMLEENMILAREKATTFLNDFDSSLNVTLSDPVILYNAQQEPEAASFTINDTGYIIVNLKSLRVPEFSLKKSSPFISQDKNTSITVPYLIMRRFHPLKFVRLILAQLLKLTILR